MHHPIAVVGIAMIAVMSGDLLSQMVYDVLGHAQQRPHTSYSAVGTQRTRIKHPSPLNPRYWKKSC